MDPSQSWVWFDFVGKPAALEHLQAELMTSGCLGGEEHDADGETTLRLYWESGAHPERLRATVEAAAASTGARRVSAGHRAQEDWLAVWKSHYAPIRITERLWVAPDWADLSSENVASTAVVVRIHPAMAFGTGDHPTTRMCLQYIDRYVKAGDTVLDIGCGSGILSIAAVLVGAASAMGIDSDTEAVENAQVNAKLNGVDESINFRVAVGGEWSGTQATHVFCNIITAGLLPLVGSIAGLIGDGVSILSGVDERHHAEARAAITDAQLTVVEEAVMDDWCAFVCRGSG